jgi:hypothetical protein
LRNGVRKFSASRSKKTNPKVLNRTASSRFWYLPPCGGGT